MFSEIMTEKKYLKIIDDGITNLIENDEIKYKVKKKKGESV